MSSLKKLSIVAAAVVLTACGGGGGDSGSSDPVPPTTNPPVVDNNYPTTIIPANYVDSQRSDIMNPLNTYRTQCGFNSLKQNSLLDTSAQGHATYNQLNKDSTHVQSATNPGFTGKNLDDRLIASGYQYSRGGEILASSTGGTMFAGSTGGIPYSQDPISGKILIKTLLSSVYHLQGAMDEWSDVGVGYSISDNLSTLPSKTNYFSTAVVNFGTPSGSQAPEYKGLELRSFPCDNVKDVSPIFISENPNPYPGRDFSVNPMGAPTIIVAPKDKTIKIIGATMVNGSDNSTISTSIINSDDDVHKRVKKWESFIIPNQPLNDNTKYSISAIVNIDGKEITKSITFTTGTQY